MQLSPWQSQAWGVGWGWGLLGTILPTSAGQNAEALWLLPRLTAEILKWKQKGSVQERLIQALLSSSVPYLASRYVFWREREKKTISDSWLTPCPVYATDGLSVIPLRSPAHKHIKTFYFQQHHTISVNKENLKHTKKKSLFWGVTFVFI